MNIDKERSGQERCRKCSGTGVEEHRFHGVWPNGEVCIEEIKCEECDGFGRVGLSALDEQKPVEGGEALCGQPQGSREAAMIVLRHDVSGTPTVWCDPEITDLVDALNNGTLSTIASCSGHGEKPGNIVLADGRELFVLPDHAGARAAEKLLITRDDQPVAGPSDQEIDDVFNSMPDGAGGWLKSWGYRQFARALLSKYAAPVNEQDVLTALDEQSTAITGWHGWACQYPGRFPRFYGAKAIAELNHDPDNGDRLFHVAEVQEDAQPVTSAPAPKVVIGRDALVDLIAEHLSGTYHCTRVWSAWSYGTMGPDDFEDVGESSTPEEIADAILERFAAPAPNRKPAIPTEIQIIEAAERAGLWPNTVREWIPQFQRYHQIIAAPVNEQDAKDAQRLNYIEHNLTIWDGSKHVKATRENIDAAIAQQEEPSRD